MKMLNSAILQSLLGSVRHKPAIFSSFFLLGCFSLFLWPTLGSSLQYYYGDTGDARFNMYLLEHSFQFVLHPHSHFWNAPFFFPTSEVITLSDNHIGVAPFYVILRWLGIEIETAYQALFILLLALNFYAALWTFKKFSLPLLPALLAAALFSFSIGFDTHWAHTQNWARFAIPPAFYHAWRWGQNGSPKHSFYAMLLLVYQFYCSIYAGMLLFFPLLLTALFSGLFHFKSWTLHSMRVGKFILIIKQLIVLAINGALLWLLMEPYYRRSLESIPIDPEYIHTNLPTWISWLSASPHSLLWKGSGNLLYVLPNFWSHRLFMGGLATLSVLFFWFTGLKPLMNSFLQKETIHPMRWITPLALAGLCSFALFSRWGDFAPYMEWVYPLPGFSALRSLNRISSILLFFPALALGFTVQYLLEKLPTKPRVLGSFLLIVLFCFDNLPDRHPQDRTALQVAQERRLLMMQKLQHLPKGTVIGYEPQQALSHPNDIQLDAMLACQALGLYCLNGYSATAPRGYWEYWERPDSSSRARIFRENNWPELDTLVVIH